MKLFGKKKPAGPSPQESIQTLKDTIETLDKREKFLEKKIEEQLSVARKNATSNKKAALIALKRKKMYEEQIEKLSAAKMNLETQVLTIENATVNLQAVAALSNGASALKRIHGQLNIDSVDAMVDDIREQTDLAKEITDALGQPLGPEIDEDELLSQLDELQQEELDSKLLDVQNVPTTSLPSVPDTELPVAATAAAKAKTKAKPREDDEDELEQLRMAMAN